MNVFLAPYESTQYVNEYLSLTTAQYLNVLHYTHIKIWLDNFFPIVAAAARQVEPNSGCQTG